MTTMRDFLTPPLQCKLHRIYQKEGDQVGLESWYFLLMLLGWIHFKFLFLGHCALLKGSKLRRLIGKRRRVEVEPTTSKSFNEKKLQNLPTVFLQQSIFFENEIVQQRLLNYPGSSLDVAHIQFFMHCLQLLLPPVYILASPAAANKFSMLPLSTPTSLAKSHKNDLAHFPISLSSQPTFVSNHNMTKSHILSAIIFCFGREYFPRPFFMSKLWKTLP